MNKTIRFTKHAEQKLIDLAELGFSVSRDQVIDAVENPDRIDKTVHPHLAQKAVSARHLLRVAYVEDGEEILIVTFYPGVRRRYES